MFNFSSSYGRAVVFQWYNDNSILVGFSNGNLSLISTKTNALGQEIASATIGNFAVEAISVNLELGKIAVAAQGSIRFL